MSNNNIKEFYVHKDELDEEKLTLLHGWCLEAGACEGDSLEEWLYFYLTCLFGVEDGHTKGYISNPIGTLKTIPFSEVRSHLNLPPLEVETSSIEYTSAELKSPVEMMETLYNGVTLYWNEGEEEYFAEGGYFYVKSSGEVEPIKNWNDFDEMCIKKETFWYDNIDPENPPLCKVSGEGNEDLQLIISIDEDGEFRTPFNGTWTNAIPTGKFKKDFM